MAKTPTKDLAKEKKPTAKAKAAPKAPPRAPKAQTAASASTAGDTAVEATGRHRMELLGTVVSDKMKKTIVVVVKRTVKHGLYKKYVERSRKVKAHDETNQAKVGDLVSIVETRPMSSEKRWALQKIVRRAHAEVLS